MHFVVISPSPKRQFICLYYLSFSNFESSLRQLNQTTPKMTLFGNEDPLVRVRHGVMASQNTMP